MFHFIMKYYIALSAVLLAASALPLDVESDDVVETYEDFEPYGGSVEPFDDHPVDDIANNASARFHTGLIGFGAATTGGAGGSNWNVFDPFALRTAIAGTVERRIIIVHGRIDLTALFEGSPGIILRISPFKTIQGANRNAEVFGGGFTINNQQHIIIRNLRLTNALSYAPGERPNGSGGILNQQPGAWSLVDAIDIAQSQLIWIDHCEFSDDPWNSNSVSENQRRHDGQIDIRNGANWISISNNIFRNHNLVTLVGNADTTGAADRNRLKTTFYYNWYRGVTQRNPRVRFGEVHVLNNLYTDIRSYGVGVGVAASIHMERNVCINTRRCWGFAAGVPNPPGYLFPTANWLTNSGHDAGIPARVTWNPTQYYRFTPQPAANVEAYVRRTAGPR